jgi:hypothetical protein
MTSSIKERDKANANKSRLFDNKYLLNTGPYVRRDSNFRFHEFRRQYCEFYNSRML